MQVALCGGGNKHAMPPLAEQSRAGSAAHLCRQGCHRRQRLLHLVAAGIGGDGSLGLCPLLKRCCVCRWRKVGAGRQAGRQAGSMVSGRRTTPDLGRAGWAGHRHTATATATAAALVLPSTLVSRGCLAPRPRPALHCAALPRIPWRPLTLAVLLGVLLQRGDECVKHHVALSLGQAAQHLLKDAHHAQSGHLQGRAGRDSRAGSSSSSRGSIGVHSAQGKGVGLAACSGCLPAVPCRAM